jgi:5-methylcytosine-specific restriction endonuclease McrA
MSVQRPRKSLTRNQRAELFLEHGGRCYLCGVAINAGRGEAWEVEHVEAREIGGRDDWANLRPAHVKCHKGKTKEDSKIIAKCNRIRNRYLGIKKPSRFPGNRNSPFKIKVGGGVERR